MGGLTVTVNDESRVTAEAEALSRTAPGTVYVVRRGYELRTATAGELAGLRRPEILAGFRAGQEIEPPETYAVG